MKLSNHLFQIFILSQNAWLSFGQDTFCTRGPDNNLLFEPMVIPCPAAGEFTTATFGVMYQSNPIGWFLPTAPEPMVDVAVSHDGGAGGIHLAMRPNACQDQDCDVAGTYINDQFEFEYFSIGERSNDVCVDEFNSNEKLCASRKSSDFLGLGDPETPTLYTAIVWNNGTCQGDITLEVSVDTSVNAERTGPPTCLSPVVPLLEPDTAVSSFVDFPDKESNCDFEEATGTTLFDALSIPCPIVGQVAAVTISYRLPAAATRFLPNVFMERQISVRHDGDNPIAGISSITGGLFIDSCDDLENAEFDPEIFGLETSDACPDKLCSVTLIQASSGSVDEVLLRIRNDGECVGNLTIEGFIQDTESNRETTCLTSLQQVCVGEEPIRESELFVEDAANAGGGGPSSAGSTICFTSMALAFFLYTISFSSMMYVVVA